MSFSLFYVLPAGRVHLPHGGRAKDVVLLGQVAVEAMTEVFLTTIGIEGRRWIDPATSSLTQLVAR
jgi:hypothetical protein